MVKQTCDDRTKKHAKKNENPRKLKHWCVRESGWLGDVALAYVVAPAASRNDS